MNNSYLTYSAAGRGSACLPACMMVWWHNASRALQGATAAEHTYCHCRHPASCSTSPTEVPSCCTLCGPNSRACIMGQLLLPPPLPLGTHLLLPGQLGWQRRRHHCCWCRRCGASCQCRAHRCCPASAHTQGVCWALCCLLRDGLKCLDGDDAVAANDLQDSSSSSSSRGTMRSGPPSSHAGNTQCALPCQADPASGNPRRHCHAGKSTGGMCTEWIQPLLTSALQQSPVAATNSDRIPKPDESARVTPLP
jgi:hypothetical protein